MQKKKGEKIYYLSGQQRNVLEKNPALEAFNAASIPVLFLTEPIDEFVVDHLREYKDHHFASILSEDIKITDEQKEKADQSKPEIDVEPLVVYLRDTYKDQLADVRISNRLVNSPCMLVTPTQAPSAQMEKLLKMTDKTYQFSKRILEINPSNKLIANLTRILAADFSDPRLKLISKNLIDITLLKEGLINSVDVILPDLFRLMEETSNSEKK